MKNTNKPTPNNDLKTLHATLELPQSQTLGSVTAIPLLAKRQGMLTHISSLVQRVEAIQLPALSSHAA